MQIAQELAAGASAYLKDLRDRDVPYELAEQLVRDWHRARLQSYYGLNLPPREPAHWSDPETIARIVTKRVTGQLANEHDLAKDQE